MSFSVSSSPSYTFSGLKQRYVPGNYVPVFIYADCYFSQNTPLEEIAKYFDGEEAKVGGGASTSTSAAVLSQMRAKKDDFEEEVTHVEA